MLGVCCWSPMKDWPYWQEQWDSTALLFSNATYANTVIFQPEEVNENHCINRWTDQHTIQTWKSLLTQTNIDVKLQLILFLQELFSHSTNWWVNFSYFTIFRNLEYCNNSITESQNLLLYSTFNPFPWTVILNKRGNADFTRQPLVHQ